MDKVTSCISFIMPVHNASEFLSQSIESLLNQSDDRWELICVDDGSGDNSWEILESFCKLDPRIKIFRFDKNSGAQNARNFAVKQASFDWIYLIDADDYVSYNFVSILLLTAKSYNADFIVPEQFHIHESEPSKNFGFNAVHGAKNDWSTFDIFLKYLKWEFHGRGMFKRSSYLKYSFDSPYAFIEEYIVRVILLNSSNVKFCNAIYYYRVNPNSICNKISVRRFHVIERSRLSEELLIEYTNERVIIESFRLDRYREVLGLVALYFANYSQLSKGERKIVTSHLKKGFGDLSILSMAKLVSVRKLSISKYVVYVLSSCSWSIFKLMGFLMFALGQRNKKEIE